MDFADYVSTVEAASVQVKLRDSTNMPAVTDGISHSHLATLSKAGERPFLLSPPPQEAKGTNMERPMHSP